MFYVFDVYDCGYCDIYDDYNDTDIVERLYNDDSVCFVGKYDTYEEAKYEADRYEDFIQGEIDKVTGNYDDDDDADY